MYNKSAGFNKSSAGRRLSDRDSEITVHYDDIIWLRAVALFVSLIQKHEKNNWEFLFCESASVHFVGVQLSWSLLDHVDKFQLGNGLVLKPWNGPEV